MSERRTKQPRNERKRNVSFLPLLLRHSTPTRSPHWDTSIPASAVSTTHGAANQFYSPQPSSGDKKNRMFCLPPVLRFITLCMCFGGGALVCLGFILFGRCNLSLPSIVMPNGPNEAVYRTLGKLEQHNAHNAISRNTQKKEKETPSVTNSHTHSI